MVRFQVKKSHANSPVPKTARIRSSQYIDD